MSVKKVGYVYWNEFCSVLLCLFAPYPDDERTPSVASKNEGVRIKLRHYLKARGSTTDSTVSSPGTPDRGQGGALARSRSGSSGVNKRYVELKPPPNEPNRLWIGPVAMDDDTATTATNAHSNTVFTTSPQTKKQQQTRASHSEYKGTSIAVTARPRNSFHAEESSRANAKSPMRRTSSHSEKVSSIKAQIGELQRQIHEHERIVSGRKVTPSSPTEARATGRHSVVSNGFAETQQLTAAPAVDDAIFVSSSQKLEQREHNFVQDPLLPLGEFDKNDNTVSDDDDHSRRCHSRRPIASPVKPLPKTSTRHDTRAHRTENDGSLALRSRRLSLSRTSSSSSSSSSRSRSSLSDIPRKHKPDPPPEQSFVKPRSNRDSSLPFESPIERKPREHVFRRDNNAIFVEFDDDVRPAGKRDPHNASKGSEEGGFRREDNVIFVEPRKRILQSPDAKVAEDPTRRRTKGGEGVRPHAAMQPQPRDSHELKDFASVNSSLSDEKAKSRKKAKDKKDPRSRKEAEQMLARYEREQLQNRHAALEQERKVRDEAFRAREQKAAELAARQLQVEKESQDRASRSDRQLREEHAQRMAQERDEFARKRRELEDVFEQQDKERQRDYETMARKHSLKGLSEPDWESELNKLRDELNARLETERAEQLSEFARKKAELQQEFEERDAKRQRELEREASLRDADREKRIVELTCRDHVLKEELERERAEFARKQQEMVSDFERRDAERRAELETLAKSRHRESDQPSHNNLREEMAALLEAERLSRHEELSRRMHDLEQEFNERDTRSKTELEAQQRDLQEARAQELLRQAQREAELDALQKECQRERRQLRLAKEKLHAEQASHRRGAHRSLDRKKHRPSSSYPKQHYARRTHASISSSEDRHNGRNHRNHRFRPEFRLLRKEVSETFTSKESSDAKGTDTRSHSTSSNTSSSSSSSSSSSPRRSFTTTSSSRPIDGKGHPRRKQPIESIQVARLHFIQYEGQVKQQQTTEHSHEAPSQTRHVKVAMHPSPTSKAVKRTGKHASDGLNGRAPSSEVSSSKPSLHEALSAPAVHLATTRSRGDLTAADEKKPRASSSSSTGSSAGGVPAKPTVEKTSSDTPRKVVIKAPSPLMIPRRQNSSSSASSRSKSSYLQQESQQKRLLSVSEQRHSTRTQHVVATHRSDHELVLVQSAPTFAGRSPPRVKQPILPEKRASAERPSESHSMVDISKQTTTHRSSSDSSSSSSSSKQSRVHGALRNDNSSHSAMLTRLPAHKSPRSAPSVKTPVRSSPHYKYGGQPSSTYVKVPTPPPVEELIPPPINQPSSDSKTASLYQMLPPVSSVDTERVGVRRPTSDPNDSPVHSDDHQSQLMTTYTSAGPVLLLGESRAVNAPPDPQAQAHTQQPGSTPNDSGIIAPPPVRRCGMLETRREAHRLVRQRSAQAPCLSPTHSTLYNSPEKSNIHPLQGASLQTGLRSHTPPAGVALQLGKKRVYRTYTPPAQHARSQADKDVLAPDHERFARADPLPVPSLRRRSGMSTPTEDLSQAALPVLSIVHETTKSNIMTSSNAPVDVSKMNSSTVSEATAREGWVARKNSNRQALLPIQNEVLQLKTTINSGNEIPTVGILDQSARVSAPSVPLVSLLSSNRGACPSFGTVTGIPVGPQEPQQATGTGAARRKPPDDGLALYRVPTPLPPPGAKVPFASAQPQGDGPPLSFAPSIKLPPPRPDGNSSFEIRQPHAPVSDQSKATDSATAPVDLTPNAPRPVVMSSHPSQAKSCSRTMSPLGSIFAERGERVSADDVKRAAWKADVMRTNQHISAAPQNTPVRRDFAETPAQGEAQPSSSTKTKEAPGRPLTAQFTRAAGEPLGISFRSHTLLSAVHEDCAGDRAGLQAFLGLRLTHINDIPVTTLREIRAAFEGNRVFALRFSPP